jgi:hypothetical protein
LKVYLKLTAFLVWFIQSGHCNPTVAASAATEKISVRSTGLDTVLKRKFLHYRKSNPSRPVRSLVVVVVIIKTTVEWTNPYIIIIVVVVDNGIFPRGRY